MLRVLLAALLIILAGTACVGVQPYEKEYLLNPIMDDQGVRSLSSDFSVTAFSVFERLASSAPGSSATSCPTCGG